MIKWIVSRSAGGGFSYIIHFMGVVMVIINFITVIITLISICIVTSVGISISI